jgi:signal transduction histidine kinase
MDQYIAAARVLIVDDEIMNILVLQQMLEQWGCVNVVSTTDPHQTLALYESFQPDIVLLDLIMPGLDGFALMEQFRQVIPAEIYLPILVLTADTNLESRRKALAAGAMDFLTKPFDRMELYLRIGHLLQTRFLHLQLRQQNQLLEQRVAERIEALRATEQRLRTVVTHAPIGLFALNREGIFTLSDGGVLPLLGLPLKDAVGQSIFTLFAGWPEILSHAHRALGGESLAEVIEMDDAVLEIWWTPEHDSAGQATGTTGVIVNISEQVQAQREAERARAASEELAEMRSDFVAAVGHELRTPLTAVIGLGQLLQTRWEYLPEVQKQELISRIVSAATRQKRLVEDLLSLTHERGASPKVTSIQLGSLLRMVIAEAQLTYPSQHIDLLGSEQVQVRANPDRLTQIIGNLIDNAAKYSPEDSSITVSWGVDEHAVTLLVRDQGSGIPQAGRELLFTRFGRIPGSVMRGGRVGTGLGLYLGREWARSMGGDLDLESTGPEGSTFRLRLPLGAGEGVNAPASRLSTTQEDVTGHNQGSRPREVAPDRTAGYGR